MRRRLFLFNCVLVLAWPVIGRSAGCHSIDVSLARLRSPVDPTRWDALGSLMSAGRAGNIPICSPAASEAIKGELLAAMRRENALIYGGRMGLSESETDFHADLLGCVASLHDARAIDDLIRAIATGGGAEGGLLALGNTAVPAVVEALRAKDVEVRFSSAMLLGTFAKQRAQMSLSDANVADIRRGLLAALQDNSALVRQSAVPSLTTFQDTEVRAAIEALAKTDTATRMMFGKPAFPVRDAASTWLRQDSVSRGLRRPPQ